MDNQIGIYRRNITPARRLIETTVGRELMLNDIEEKLDRNKNKKGGQHYLFIGPRGIGKTHFLSLIEIRVKENAGLNKNYTVIRFPEENNRILSFADLLLGVIEILGDVAKDDKLQTMYDMLSVNDNDTEIIDTIIPCLKQRGKTTGNTLLIMIENMDVMFTQQIKNENDIHGLRKFLMDSPCATLIGASPVYFPGLYNDKSPLYDFFDIQTLDEMDETETIEVIKKNLEYEKRAALLQDFDSLRPKILSIYTMTGGNPRLIIMLYELIANDNILEVKAQFQKLLDQISPFYQDRLKDLPPQERALLETVALIRDEPKTPANIAARMRKPQQQTSSLLKRMTKSGYLATSTNPDDKRSRLYTIKEGFFDLWLAMSESRTYRKRFDYLIEFFKTYYKQRDEREKKRFDLWEKINKGTDKTGKNDNYLEALDYLTEVGDGSEKGQTKLELAIHKLKDGDNIKAKELVKEASAVSPKTEAFIWMTDQANQWAKAGGKFDTTKWLDEMVEYWRTLRSGDLEKAITIAHKLGNDFSEHGLHKLRIELLSDTINHTKNKEKIYKIYMEIADSQEMEGQYLPCIDTLQKALNICNELRDKNKACLTLNSIGNAYYRVDKYEEALDYSEKSLTISVESKDKQIEGSALNNISAIYLEKGDNDNALNYLKQSLKISCDIGDKRGQGVTLNNIGAIYIEKGDNDIALDYLKQSLKTRCDINDKRGQIPPLHNIAMIENERGNYKEMFKLGIDAYNIAKEIGDAIGLFKVGKNIGEILTRDEKTKEMGIEMLKTAFQIGQNAGLPGTEEIKETLFKFGKKDVKNKNKIPVGSSLPT